MSILLILTAVAVCIAVSETKERTASLVVLPPLIIGYDELYHDSEEGNITRSTHKTPERNPQRTMIDTKGRRLFARRNYRSILKRQKARNVVIPSLTRRYLAGNVFSSEQD